MIDKKRTTGKREAIKVVYHKFWPVFFLFFPISIFFLRLFYPEQSLFMIPDFGESDVLHLNLPFKEILSRSLKSGQWPLWTPYLANGFPLLAEGQMGTFYLPNLTLFRYLDTITAYNVNLVIAYLFSFIGVYLFVKLLNFSSKAALFASLVFTFSGFLAVHLNHFNLIQASSLLPLLFWACYLLWKKPSVKRVILFSFLLSQQIFAGHFYIVFITLVGIAVFWICLALTFGNNIKKWTALFFGLISAFLLSSIQLLPTIELWQVSARRGGLSFEAVTSYPYPFSHLLTFINPYLFGNPDNGTYPPFSNNWGIFWENTAYVGILPLVLALLSIFFFQKKIVKIFLIMLFISMLLVLGRNSPLYFVFSFPPFNFFRVPSKFLLLTAFSLSILSGFVFERIIMKVTSKPFTLVKSWLSFLCRLPPRRAWSLTLLHKIFKFIFIALFFSLIIIDEYRFSYNYPPVTPASWWLEPPEAVGTLPNDEGRLASIGATISWNDVFLKEGWQDMTPYVFLRNSLYPNYNVLFNISQVDINTGGLRPRRSELLSQLTGEVNIDRNQNVASLSAVSKNVLSLSSTKYVVSSFPITDVDFIKTDEIIPHKDSGLNSFFIYQNKQFRPRAYLTSRSKKVSTVEEVYRLLSEQNFQSNPVSKRYEENNQILIEDENLTMEPISEVNGNVSIISDKNLEVVLKTESKSKTILVLADTNYPDWKAFVDKKKAEIFTVNISQRGVLLPSGSHQVRFVYKPQSFQLGKKITIISSFITVLAVFLSSSSFPDRTFGNTLLFPHLLGKKKS